MSGATLTYRPQATRSESTSYIVTLTCSVHASMSVCVSAAMQSRPAGGPPPNARLIMVGVGRPPLLCTCGAALSGRCSVAKGRGEMSARGGELVNSGPGRLWAEGRNPARKADVEGLYLAKDATLSRSTES